MKTVRETIEWRLISFVVTFIITYLWTGELLEASGLTIVLNGSKTVLFYLWRKFKKGTYKGTIEKDGLVNNLKTRKAVFTI